MTKNNIFRHKINQLQTIFEFLSKGACKGIKGCYNMSINWFLN